MKNKEFQDYLKTFPDNMEIKAHHWEGSKSKKVSISTDYALKWTDTANYDEDTGKTTWGTGEKYILFNYPLQ